MVTADNDRWSRYGAHQCLPLDNGSVRGQGQGQSGVTQSVSVVSSLYDLDSLNCHLKMEKVWRMEREFNFSPFKAWNGMKVGMESVDRLMIRFQMWCDCKNGFPWKEDFWRFLFLWFLFYFPAFFLCVEWKVSLWRGTSIRKRRRNVERVEPPPPTWNTWWQTWRERMKRFLRVVSVMRIDQIYNFEEEGRGRKSMSWDH